MYKNRRILIERVGRDDLARVTILRRTYADNWHESRVDHIRDHNIPALLKTLKPMEVIDKRETF